MLFRLVKVAALVGVLAGCDLRPPPKGNAGMVDPSTQAAGTPGTPDAMGAPGAPDAMGAPTGVLDAAVGVAVPTMQVTPTTGPPGMVDGGIAVVPVPTLDAAVVAPSIEPSQECDTVGVRIAGIMIEGTVDPTQKASLEQERAKLIRNMSIACTRDHWSDTAMKCFLGATTNEALQTCAQGLSAP